MVVAALIRIAAFGKSLLSLDQAGLDVLQRRLLRHYRRFGRNRFLVIVQAAFQILFQVDFFSLVFIILRWRILFLPTRCGGKLTERALRVTRLN